MVCSGPRGIFPSAEALAGGRCTGGRRVYRGRAEKEGMRTKDERRSHISDGDDASSRMEIVILL
jgi:hypothetical protein